MLPASTKTSSDQTLYPARQRTRAAIERSPATSGRIHPERSEPGEVGSDKTADREQKSHRGDRNQFARRARGHSLPRQMNARRRPNQRNMIGRFQQRADKHDGDPRISFAGRPAFKMSCHFAQKPGNGGRPEMATISVPNKKIASRTSRRERTSPAAAPCRHTPASQNSPALANR